MKYSLILTLVFILLLLPGLAIAVPIFTSDSEGKEKMSFYTNETVYLTSNASIATGVTTIKFYIATHRTWSSGTNLTTAAVISKNIDTNSSGHVNVTLIWNPILTVGTYDMIADMNNNATFDSEDHLYNATGDGFSVLEQPLPSLSVVKGLNSPPNHDWYAELNGSEKNVMLQINLTAGIYDAIKVTSFFLVASGTGDDKNGVSLVTAYDDGNGNGIYDQGESFVGYGQYLRDDGIVVLDTKDKITIPSNSSMAVIFVYTMKSAAGSAEGKTYGFDLASIDATGVNLGTTAKIIGLPISSAVKTVYSTTMTTTTIPITTTTVPATTTTVPATTTTVPATTTTVPAGETKDLIIGLSIAGFVVIAIVALLYFFLLRPPQPYHYTPH
jgi:hypothetical protein